MQFAAKQEALIGQGGRVQGGRERGAKASRVTEAGEETESGREKEKLSQALAEKLEQIEGRTYYRKGAGRVTSTLREAATGARAHSGTA